MNFKIFLLLSILAVINKAQGKELLEQCTNDQECNAKNEDIVCRPNKPNTPYICYCKPGKKPGSQGADGQVQCVDVLKSTCDTDSDCDDIEGAICEQKYCVCKRNFYPDNDKCVMYTGNCISSVQCKSVLGEKGECQRQECVCQENFHMNSTRDGCIETKRLHEQCTTDDECYQKIGVDNALRCNGPDRKCVCKDGFLEKGDECSGASNIFGFSILVLLLTAVVAQF